MPKPKYIRIDTRPKAKPKREPYIRCQKTGKQRTAEEMMIERQITTKPDCLFYVSEKKCDALLYINCRDCKFYKPKKWGEKKDIERAIKDYEKLKSEQRRETH